MTSLLFIPLNNTSEFSIHESHHSQTHLNAMHSLPAFNHIRESHHSQTRCMTFALNGLFNHIRESHHSQTH